MKLLEALGRWVIAMVLSCFGIFAYWAEHRAAA